MGFREYRIDSVAPTLARAVVSDATNLPPLSKRIAARERSTAGLLARRVCRATGTMDALAESQPLPRHPASGFRGFDLGVGFG
jgi:hypothetical protein